MKITVQRILRDERGAAMVLALILLLVGGLIAAPLLSHMGTGLVAGEVYETRTAELYAADAGVENAVWKIQNQDGYLPCSPGSPATNYTLTDVNGKTVDVNIASVFAVNNMTFIYRVLSTATGDDSETQIEAYIEGVNKYGDYAGILENVITSQGEYTVKGDVYYPEGHGPVANYDGDWPTAEELEDFYWEDVKDEDPYAFDTIDLAGVDMDLGPLYRDGELEILNSSNTPATLSLTGTTYVTGDTLIGKTGKDFNLDLNGQTIFVESDTAGNQKALWLGGKCAIEGPGVIVAVGDIYFEPNIEAGMTEPIFIMSVEGTTTMQPGGDFYGAVAGSVEVELQPGTSLNYPEEEGWYDDLDFLIGVQQLVYSIDSWEVSQQ